MTFKVEWSEPAICDLERIGRYLRRRNPTAANKIGELLLKKAELLGQYPDMGPEWEEDSRWRFLVVRPYKMFYRILSDKKVVEISHLRHGSRSAPPLDELLTE